MMTAAGSPVPGAVPVTGTGEPGAVPVTRTAVPPTGRTGDRVVPGRRTGDRAVPGRRTGDRALYRSPQQYRYGAAYRASPTVARRPMITPAADRARRDGRQCRHEQ
jgi:hypothetical protein